MIAAAASGSVGETTEPSTKAAAHGKSGTIVCATTATTPLTAAQDATLRILLRGVVTGGTGLGLKDIPGLPVIAKTGTAEFDRNGKRLTHAWMIGAQGDLAVCAFVDVGTTGAGTAGPLLEQFLRSAHAG